MILLAESGSTKTDWRVLGKEVFSFETIGLNPYFITSETVQAELTPFLHELTRIGVEEVHFYGTGITDPQKGEIIAEGIRKTLKASPKIYTYSDVIAAARSLFGDSEGIACILGTGSNSCFWNGKEITYQVPPLGFWLGDEGSGGYLGKALILAYLHKELPQDLRTKFDDIYGPKDRLEIINFAYQQEKPNRYFAQYTPFILENIQHPFAHQLVVQAFQAFLDKYLLKYPQVRETQIGAVGSIAHYFEAVLQEVAAKNNLRFSKIIQKPIFDLEKYHQPK